jgi:hypothetical protein
MALTSRTPIWRLSTARRRAQRCLWPVAPVGLSLPLRLLASSAKKLAKKLGSKKIGVRLEFLLALLGVCVRIVHGQFLLGGSCVEGIFLRAMLHSKHDWYRYWWHVDRVLAGTS